MEWTRFLATDRSNNLTVTRVNHKYGYRNYFVIALVIPLIYTLLANYGIC